jgi:aspartyl aminopeptidase
MPKKLSIVRFKPKPECFDEFLQNIQAWQSQVHADDDHLLMRTDEEVVAVVVRDSEMLQQNIQLGVAWLDSQRALLQEYNEVDRHTLPMTGDLVV